MTPKILHRTVKIDEISYHPDLFIPIKTHSPLDYIWTIDGGVPKATNWFMFGDPGVGKSTITMDIISNAQNRSKSKVLFISAEMSKIDLYLYVKRYPKFGNIDILFTSEFDDSELKSVVETQLSYGYDMVLIDSLIELQEQVRYASGMSNKQAEGWMLDIMDMHNNAENKTKSYTTFLIIQQATKGGNFVGSNRLKHMTSGTIEMKFEEDGENRYIVFSKNRRGNVGEKMYFDLSTGGDVLYDYEKFKKEKDNKIKMKQLKKEVDKIKHEGTLVDELFSNAKVEETLSKTEA